MTLDPTAVKAPEEFVKLGRLGRTFQLEGALRVLLDEAVSYEGEDGSAPVAVRAIEASGQLFVSGLGSVRVRQLYENGGALLLKLEGVRERNAAQALVNSSLWVDPARLPPELAEELAGEVEAGTSEERLIGQPVLLNGSPVGEVSAATLDSPNPFLEVTLQAVAAADESEGAQSGRTARPRKSLIPMQAPYVELTDEGVELTDPPDGLLDLD